MSQVFRDVGIQISAKTRDIMLAVARELRAKHSARIHLYTRGPEEERFFNNWPGDKCWDSVTDAAKIPSAILETEIDEACTIARAKEWETRIGRTVNELTFSHRHLGRGYALGGFRHPHAATYDDAGYLQTIHAYVCQLEFWDGEMDRRGLTLLLQGDNVAQAVAASRQVPARFLIGARYKSLWFWASDQYQSNPLLPAAWAAARPGPLFEVDESYVGANVKRAEFADWISLRKLPFHTAYAIATMTYWRIRRLTKGRAYNYWEFISWPARQYLGLHEVKRWFSARLDDLKGKPFVYFPMHKEPEESFLLRSPEFFSQHAAIASLSRSLPAGTLLAIKENSYAIARRPRDFYRQIAALKNVVLLDVNEDGIECVRRASAVATITGTAGIEAAAMGQPVISFAQHHPMSMLPHVQTVKNESDLSKMLSAALSPEFDRAKAEADGQRFLRAIADSAFDLGQFKIVRPGQITILPEWVVNAVQGLETSLTGQLPLQSTMSDARYKAVS
ncbi:MAG: hypothetical protein K2Y27_30690 [Xanthobacteraceae bacterium]|nr:hypothetical protein [Xanthobacteraceae bacterium]